MPPKYKYQRFSLAKGRASHTLRFPLIFGSFLVGVGVVLYNFKTIFKDRIAEQDRKMHTYKYGSQHHVKKPTQD